MLYGVFSAKRSTFGIQKLYDIVRSMFGIRSRLLNVVQMLHYRSVKGSTCYIVSAFVCDLL